MSAKPPIVEAAELAAAAFDLMKRWDDCMSSDAAEALARLLLEAATEHMESVRYLAGEIRAEALKEAAAEAAFKDGGEP